MWGANDVARETRAPPTWGRRTTLAGQPATFCRTHEKSTSEGSRAAFSMAAAEAPYTRRRCAGMLRPMSQADRTPLGGAILGLEKTAARSETKQARPFTKEGADQFIHGRSDSKERVVFRLARMTASRWSEIAALTFRISHCGRVGP
ncbi:hypothetical protein TcYC6_0109220 [Trypanosoma cruzi]|nr:hypothetical protein TcYC6_0109220 [Trypanosoma cruzi]